MESGFFSFPEIIVISFLFPAARSPFLYHPQVFEMDPDVQRVTNPLDRLSSPLSISLAVLFNGSSPLLAAGTVVSGGGNSLLFFPGHAFAALSSPALALSPAPK